MVNDFPEDLSFEVSPPMKLKSSNFFKIEPKMEIESFDMSQKKKYSLIIPSKFSCII